MRRCFTLSLVLLACIVGPAAAQDADPMEEGILAFRAGEYDDAERAFRRVIEADPNDAEAYYLLARLYYETPLDDVRAAQDAIKEARRLDPDNVRYMVADLELLRREANNFIAELTREERRRILARRILEIDSTNAFAHEELGITYIHDFWRYRNAVAIPGLVFGESDYKGPEDGNFDSPLDPEGDPQNNGGSVGSEQQQRLVDFATANFDVNRVFVDDRYDIDRLESQGVPIQDLSARGDYAYERAVEHLNKAIASDPRRRSVYTHLMRLYALRDEPDEALDMLNQMYVYFPDDADLWLYLGFAHHRAQNLAAAAKSFQEAFQHGDAALRSAFESLALVLPDDEKAAYEADPTGYAARFWGSKDPRYLTPYNERRLEHYARHVYADLLYGVPDLALRGWETDRGSILVRYGIPLRDMVVVADGATNSTGVGLSSTVGMMDATDFSADMVLDANTFNIWEYGDFRFVFEDPLRSGRYRLYSPPADQLAGAGQGITMALQNDYVRKARETFREVPERYTYTPQGRRIDVPFLVSSFKGEEDGRDDLYVHFGLPITAFDPQDDVIELTATLGTFLIGEDRQMLSEQRKRIYGLPTEQVVSFDEASLWVSTQAMAAPPGEHEVSVEFETTSGATVGVQRRAVHVPTFREGELALSDLLLAYRVEETDAERPQSSAEIVRRGLSIMPAPWSVFDHQRPIYLYFEVYNLGQRADGQTNYEVEAALIPKTDDGRLGRFFKGLFGRDEKGVSVRLPNTGVSPDDGQYLILDAANQEPGLYVLALRVKDTVSGETVEAEQDLYLE